MEATPSPSRPFKAFGSPVMKRKISHFSENEKVMIINVFKHVMGTWPAEKYRSQQEMKDKTADILGISKSAVYRILKEYVQTDTVKPAVSPKKRSSGAGKKDRVSKKKKPQRGWVFVGPAKDKPVKNKIKINSKNNTADVKKEPEWDTDHDVPQVKQELTGDPNTGYADTGDAEEACLPMDIGIKQEIEVGPVQLQPQDIYYSYKKEDIKKW